ncbi:hypothetical protein ACWDUN_17560 [Mycobacterium sp. NPDC003323]
MRTSARAALLVAVCLAVAVSAGCSRSSDGTPVAVAPGTDSGHPDSGVLPTTGSPIPADTVTCEADRRPPVAMVAKVDDPMAPAVTVAVLDGWSMQGGSGDVGAQLNGPDGMSATVRIMATTLDPQAAFADHADRLTESAAVYSSLVALPAPMCGYSGQKLLGGLSGTSEGDIQFVERVLHIPTEDRDYLVAVHTEAPAQTAGFDAVATQVTDIVEVGIP